MTSDKKIAANRQNALKSTGPRTREGKDAVRLNALKHGLLSQEVLLPGENSESLQDLEERLRAELQPIGELENLLVEQIIAAYWRLRRLRRVETGIFAWVRSEELAEQAERNARGYELEQSLVETFRLSFTEVTDREEHEKALSRAREIRSAQEAEDVTLGRTFARDADKANAFSKLARYETAIEQRLFKALHELERRQVARSGGNVPAPLAADINVSGLSEGDR